MLRRSLSRWTSLFPVLLSGHLAVAAGFTFPLDWKDEDHRYHVGSTLRLDGSVSWQRVRSTLGDPAGWCALSLLVPDVQGCTVRQGQDTEIVLQVQAGEEDQPRTLPHRFEVHAGDDALTASMRADRGPLGISDAGLTVTALRTPDGVVLELVYGYRASLRSRIATGTYLATVGRDRPGISYRELPDGGREYVTGTRALLERNAMRYFLAVAAVLETADTESAIAAWYDTAAGFTADLPEQDRESYVRGRRALRTGD